MPFLSPNLPIQAYWKRNLIKILDRAFRLRSLCFWGLRGGGGGCSAFPPCKAPASLRSAVRAAAVLPAAGGRSPKPRRCPGSALPRHADQWEQRRALRQRGGGGGPAPGPGRPAASRFPSERFPSRSLAAAAGMDSEQHSSAQRDAVRELR